MNSPVSLALASRPKFLPRRHYLASLFVHVKKTVLRDPEYNTTESRQTYMNKVWDSFANDLKSLFAIGLIFSLFLDVISSRFF